MIGISDQYFDTAQYLASRLFVTAITNTILIWFIILLTHNHANFLIYHRLNLNKFRFSLIVFNLKMNHIFNQNVIN